MGIIVAAAYAASVTPTRGAYVDNMMTAASLGVPLWGVASVIVFPLLSGRHAVWNTGEMSDLFTELVGWIFFGSLLGLLLQTFEDLAERRFGLEVIPSHHTSPDISP